MNLIERLQQATGPDRILDAYIFLATSDAAKEIRSWVPRHDFGDEEHTFSFVVDDTYPEQSEIQLIGVLKYTASIDAALALAPHDWSWRVGNLPSGRGFADLGTQKSLRCVEGATPAIALCLAALTASTK